MFYMVQLDLKSLLMGGCGACNSAGDFFGPIFTSFFLGGVL